MQRIPRRAFLGFSGLVALSALGMTNAHATTPNRRKPHPTPPPTTTTTPPPTTTTQPPPGTGFGAAAFGTSPFGS